LVHKRKSTKVPTGYEAKEKFWDDSKLEVKRGKTSIINITRFYALLLEKRKRVT